MGGISTRDLSRGRVVRRPIGRARYAQMRTAGRGAVTHFSGRIGRGTRGGAPAVTLAEVSDAVNGAVIADCFLYFTLDQGDVGRLPVEGGDVQWLASGQGISLGIAVDDEAIYWVNADGTVRRLDK